MVCEDSTSSSDNVCSHDAGGSLSLVQLYHPQSTGVQEQRDPLDEPYRTPYSELLSNIVSTLNVVPDGGHAEISMVSPPATTAMNLVAAAYMARTSRGPKQARRQQEGLVPDSQNSGPGLMMTTHLCNSNSCGGAVLHNRFSVLNVIEEALDLLDDIDGDDFYPDWSPPRPQSSSVRESGRMRHSRDIRDNRLKRQRADHETQN